ncbi:DDE_3 domain-containing protein [Trichonephila clavipes]|nr:DDE_3 domain-containing protein [Trichonephila clavipes]
MTHEAMDPVCKVGTVQGMMAQLWSAGSFLGTVVFFVLIPTSLNALWVLELLEYHLHIRLCCPVIRTAVFQQENCTSHKFRLATGWLHEHSSDFSVIN